VEVECSSVFVDVYTGDVLSENSTCIQ